LNDKNLLYDELNIRKTELKVKPMSKGTQDMKWIESKLGKALDKKAGPFETLPRVPFERQPTLRVSE
jgi:hypothetical protein